MLKKKRTTSNRLGRKVLLFWKKLYFSPKKKLNRKVTII